MIYCKNNCGYDAGTHTMCINMPGLVYKDDCNYTWCVCKVFLLLIFKGNEYCGNKIFILKILIMWDLHQLIQWAMYCNIFKKSEKKIVAGSITKVDLHYTLVHCLHERNVRRGSTGRNNGQRGLTWKGCEGGRDALQLTAMRMQGGGGSRSRSAGSLLEFAWVSIKRIHA